MKDDTIMWEQFIAESPWLYKAVPSETDTRMSNIDYTEFNKIDRFEDFDIYENKAENDNIQLFFVKDDKLISYYEFTPLDGPGVKTAMTWNDKNYKGTFSYILAKYLLPKFKLIESGDSLSKDAFSMWKNMIVRFPEYNYYAKKNGEMKKLVYPDDVYLFQDNITDRENSVFIATI